MAKNFLWDTQSPNPTPDVENPSVAIDNTASPNNTRREGSSFSIPKAVKLGFFLVAVAGVVALGVVLGRNSSSEDGLPTQTASASSVAQQSPVTESNNPNPDNVESPGPLEARVKKVSPSILDGYETCSDLESDITEALKLLMNEVINSEAISGEIYAKCDPNNENWYGDLYGYDDDAYYYYDANYTCSPAGNTTTSCAADSAKVPWVVTWHVGDNAEGELFYNETQAREEYDNVNASWAKRLYGPSKAVVEEYGLMEPRDWCQLESWAYDAQCNLEAPTNPKKKKAVKKVILPMPKQMRSSIPSLEKRTGSLTPGVRANNDNENNKPRSKNRSMPEDSFGQNSQNSDANEQDKVVSDGTYIYAAYGDVLYTWLAADSTGGVSITHMPGKATECEWNTTEPCTVITKPNIQALFLGNSRLTVVVSQTSYNMQDNLTQPIFTNYGTKADVRVYDVSDISLGSSLKQVGHKELTGIYTNGRSVGDKTIIATTTYMDTYLAASDLYRYQPQYCGLDTASYKKLAAETAKNKVQLFAKQMVTELELVNDCSKIIQISTMQSASDEPDAETPGVTKADFLGSFVQVSTFDMSSDFGIDGDIPLTVAGSFAAGYFYSIYLAEDFLAIPSSVYKYNYTSETGSYQTFIIGFDLLSEHGVTPYCYGHIPAGLDNNYRMDKVDNHLRIMTSEATIVDAANWTYAYINKMYVLEIPSIQDGTRTMSVVGESEKLADEEEYITGSRFVKDKAYISTSSMNYQQDKDHFVIVDLSDDSNPQAVGSLKIGGSLSYMQQIEINNVPYILGIGYETNYSTYQSFMKLVLIDVSTPLSPEISASYKDVSGSYTDSSYDFLTIRYLLKSQKLVVPVTKNLYQENGFADGFTVYDVSENSITPAFNVTHSKEFSYCYNEASLPARSFVIQSELTTIKGHTAISTDMQSGRFISELDLDVGLNYSVCDDSYYYLGYPYYGHDYVDEFGDAANATKRD